MMFVLFSSITSFQLNFDRQKIGKAINAMFFFLKECLYPSLFHNLMMQWGGSFKLLRVRPVFLSCIWFFLNCIQFLRVGEQLYGQGCFFEKYAILI
jgi:hypothetical protein